MVAFQEGDTVKRKCYWPKNNDGTWCNEKRAKGLQYCPRHYRMDRKRKENMENIEAAKNTLHGRLVYRNGNGPGLATYVEFSLTVGDNCCSEHAKGMAQWLMQKGIERNNELEAKHSFPEPIELMVDYY